MEAMVSQLTAHLGGLTDNPEKAWGPLLNDLDHYIKKLPVSNPAEKAIRDNWSSCHVNLRHVKDATRNATMHPRQFYSPSEAREIFEASRVFIRDLASLIC